MQNTKTQPVIITILLVAVGVGVYSAITLDPSGSKGNRLGNSFEYDLSEDRKIAAELYGFHQINALKDERFKWAGGLAIDHNNLIYIAGKESILILDRELKISRSLKVESGIQALTTAEDGSIFTADQNRIRIYGRDGALIRQWPIEGDNTYLTSITVGENDVFVADKGQRVVWRYQKSGEFVNEIGRRDDARNIPGFSIPSPYFEVAIAGDGLLRVTNPGSHWIVAYTFDGDREFAWGESGRSIEGFCGCCNPSHFAIFPDGRFVTSEKGITRIKVYNAEGKFESVVAGPAEFMDHDGLVSELKGEADRVALEVGVTNDGEVVVLDPLVGEVRIFAEKK